MARNRTLRRATPLIFTFFIALFVLGVFAPLPSTSHNSPQFQLDNGYTHKFEIAEDMFWRDGEPFRIIGGDLHYFRVHPEYWRDRLLRAKALGLNTVQTYVPWNLHEPKKGHLVFEGIADIISFLELCKELDMLVMLRAGPYICGEWDLGGFPAWLLAEEPAIRLRSSDPAYLGLVEKWWGILLPKVSPLLFSNGGPIVMVQIENEFGSYGDDKAYLHYLVKLARRHLGDDIILYTTDGGARENLEKGTIRGDAVFSAVDFSTGADPWPIFKLQKEFNAPGRSPPISTEFYTGWLTHWGETIASTDAVFTATYLEKILSKNGSVVLYMVHGGTNFGFYNGANTGDDESAYKPDLTSYDYDAPISESGDVDNAKYKALRSVIAKYSPQPLASVPSNNEKIAYGRIKLDKSSFLYDATRMKDLADVVESENPLSMEAIGQMFGFVLYASEYSPKGNGSVLSIPKVHDRAQVFVSCAEDSGRRPTYVDVITRWSNRPVHLPPLKCKTKNQLFILVENMGRLNYGPYIFDRKGILSPVYLDGRQLHKWKMLPISLDNLNEALNINPIIHDATSAQFLKRSAREKLKGQKKLGLEPAFYSGRFNITKVGDTYISFRGWSKGIAFVNEINIGRFWPSAGPQCNLYVPAPILRQGENTVVVLEVESPKLDLFVSFVNYPDFTCGSKPRGLRRVLAMA
ncbi:beta-galactosidase 17 [Salvia miltiorrhiza]|uniref:beta-galactosidase 17 n=1 Tax=Salvia miltiorrhiza TaxID=226208 RepID=UPI0025AD60F5|nr:beta-galactosidase 17 [Salvia miltiorrhiza]